MYSQDRGQYFTFSWRKTFCHFATKLLLILFAMFKNNHFVFFMKLSLIAKYHSSYTLGIQINTSPLPGHIWYIREKMSFSVKDVFRLNAIIFGWNFTINDLYRLCARKLWASKIMHLLLTCGVAFSSVKETKRLKRACHWMLCIALLP